MVLCQRVFKVKKKKKAKNFLKFAILAPEHWDLDLNVPKIISKNQLDIPNIDFTASFSVTSCSGGKFSLKIEFFKNLLTKIVILRPF